MATKIVALTGNQAAAEAMRQINFDVAAVYPISPQTELMGFFAEYVANGEVDTEMVAVDLQVRVSLTWWKTFMLHLV